MRQRFLVKGIEYDDTDPTLQAALAAVYNTPDRPRCLCVAGGVEMYVAKYSDFVLKRLPDTGSKHHPTCASYDMEGNQSGRGELLGSAITEHNANGWEIRTKFPLTQVPGRSIVRGEPGTPTEAAASPKSASMLALLHELWERVGLNRWYPAMAGKRNWGLVRSLILQEASRALTKNQRLSEVMLLPEPFDRDRMAEQEDQRRKLLSRLTSPLGDVQHRMLIVLGEFKEVQESALGFRLKLKHMSELALHVDATMWRKVRKSFETQLRVHESDDSTRLMLGGLIYSPADQTYALRQVTLMLLTSNWIPIEDGNDNELLQRLTEHKRRFIRPLRYDSKRWGAFANARLLDTGDEAVALHVMSERLAAEVKSAKKAELARTPGAWVWNVDESMAAFPPIATPGRFALQSGGRPPASPSHAAGAAGASGTP